MVNVNESPDLEYFDINGTYRKTKVYECDSVFLPKPQLAPALCDMEALSYFRQQQGFVAGWVLLKQLHGI